MFVCNVSDPVELDPIEKKHVDKVKEKAKEQGAFSILISGKIESELLDLSPEESKEFLEDLGLSEPGLNSFIRSGHKLLNLQTYITAGPKEFDLGQFLLGAKLHKLQELFILILKEVLSVLRFIKHRIYLL